MTLLSMDNLADYIDLDEEVYIKRRKGKYRLGKFFQI